MTRTPTIPTPREHAERLLEAATRRGDHRSEALARIDLGVALMRGGMLDDAIGLLKQALAVADRERFPEVAIEARLQLGLARLAHGDANGSMDCFSEVLRVAREGGDTYREKLALDFIGRHHATVRKPEAAIAVYREAQEIARELGDSTHQAELTWSEAIQRAELGLRDEAIERANAAITLFRRLNHPHVGILAEHLGRYQAVGGVLPGMDGSEPIPGVFIGSGRSVRPATNDSVAPPGLLRMAMSAMKAMSLFVGSGAAVVSSDERERRLAICNDCENHTGSRCRLCGCFTQLKTWLPHERCPASKWEGRA